LLEFARSEHPKSRTCKSFTSCALKTANETVGSLLSMVLTVLDNRVFEMMDKVDKKQQQRCLTFPVTAASTPRNVPTKPMCVQKKKETKPSQKVKVSLRLVARDIELLELFPSRCNCTCRRDGTNDPKKEEFPPAFRFDSSGHATSPILGRHAQIISTP
jgi:hypothetical protein